MSKVINICNQKGGTGKSTVAIELCTLLDAMGYSVLGIDLDPQGNFSKYSNADLTKPSIYNVLNAELLLEEATQKVKHYDIIIASEILANAGKEFGEVEDYYLLRDVLETDCHDFVIIDNAPARSPLLTMTYFATDYCIIITESDDGSIDGVIKITQDIKRLKERSKDFTHAVLLGVLLNKNERTNAHKTAYEKLQNMANEIGVTPFKTTISKSIIATDSKSVKMSMNEYDYDNTASSDFRQFVAETLERIERVENNGGE